MVLHCGHAVNSRIDFSELKEYLPDLLSILPEMKKKTAKEVCGPCFKCGGKDRLYGWPKTGKVRCRQCGWKGDTIDILADIHHTDIAGIAKMYGPPVGEVTTPKQPPLRETVKRTPSKPFVHYQLGEPVEKYPYTDDQGNILLYSCRFEPKAFRQCTPNGLEWKVQGIRQVPYRLERILSSTGLVLICEGEKDVHTAESMGFIATTNAGGAGNWTDEHSRYLAGRDVVIISDDDDAGHARNAKVALSLVRVAGSEK